jgi:hypothetical protein
VHSINYILDKERALQHRLLLEKNGYLQMADELARQVQIIQAGVKPWRRHMDQVKENHHQRKLRVANKPYDGVIGSVVYVYDQGKNRLAKAADWGGATLEYAFDELSHWSARNLTYPKAYAKSIVSSTFGDINLRLEKSFGEQNVQGAYNQLSKAYQFYAANVYGNMTPYQQQLFQPMLESVLVGGASAAIVRARSGAPALVVTNKNAKTSIVFNINKPVGNPPKLLALENKVYNIGEPRQHWRKLAKVCPKTGKITIKGTQLHHIIHQSLDEHRLFKAAGINVEVRSNKIRLPDKRGLELWDTKRSIHQGRHDSNIAKGLERRMDEILREGEFNGYEMMDYRNRLVDLMRKEYIELHQGRVPLNKNRRAWAIEPAKKK